MGMTVKGADTPREAGPQWRLVATRRRWVVRIAVLVAVVTGSLAFWLAGNGDGSPGTTVIRNGEVWLQGRITQDTCDMSETHVPIGDVGCSVTVNGYEVRVVHGNALQRGKPGTVTGLDVSKDQTGQHADVYAQLIGPHSASILSVPKYYARIHG
jgi:hypothetical protein